MFYYSKFGCDNVFVVATHFNSNSYYISVASVGIFSEYQIILLYVVVI